LLESEKLKMFCCVRVLTGLICHHVSMDSSQTTVPHPATLSRQTDYVWRITELALILVGFALWLLGLESWPGVAVALLAGSWGARFVWAAKNVNELERGRLVSKVERLTTRGAHLALTVALYLSLLEGTTLAVFFLFGTLALILTERVSFMAEKVKTDRSNSE
jgi:hypothetical protein